MSKKILLRFESVSHGLEEQWDIRQFSWDLALGDRVWITCDRSEQTAVLWRFFQRKLKPKSGRIEDIHQVFTTTDELIRQGVNLKKNMYDNLQSRLFSEHVWVERRHHVHALLELLEIEVAARRLPLEHVAPAVFNRFWLLMFVAAKARILLVNVLLDTLDSLTTPVFTQWLKDFSGALVIFGPHDSLSSFAWQRLHIQSDGEARLL